MNPKISVILPIRNEESKIGQCLDAIFGQTILPYEVIVIDGHSTDNTEKIAKKYPIRFYYEDYHTRSGACQIGIMKSNGDLIAFTDADCIPQKDWLENLEKGFDEGIVGVGGGIKNVGEGLWERSINLAMSTFIGSANSVQGRFFKSKRFVKSISGCNSMYHRNDLLDVGGFNVLSPGAEDAELNRKLLVKGKLLYNPEALVIHHHSWTLKEYTKKMFRYGFERGLIRALDLQVIPPFFALLVILSLLFTPYLFLASIVSYLLIILFFGIRGAQQEHNIRYLFSVPVVYIVEHSMYTLGMWKSVVSKRRGA